MCFIPPSAIPQTQLPTQLRGAGNNCLKPISKNFNTSISATNASINNKQLQKQHNSKFAIKHLIIFTKQHNNDILLMEIEYGKEYMFNKSQQQAINFLKGPAMVLAGPGSGKTTVITHRIKNLINKGVAPESIMVVTFTKAAAVHMEKKFTELMAEGHRTYPVTFGTFHGIFFKILRMSLGYKGNCIVTERTKYDILREIVLRKHIESDNTQELIQGIIGEIGNIKGNMVDLIDYEPKCCKKEEFLLVYREYEKTLSKEKKIDFDDILLRCHELFVKRPDILKQWQNVYRYILIDEFQDINTIQYKTVKMLACPDNNIFIVGDDDQSIYGFRGACPEIMGQFTKDYENGETIIMNINYRSGETIVAASENLIKNNKNRYGKNIIPNTKGGKEVDVRQFKNKNQELLYVAKKIKKYLEKGVKPSDIAILVRNNSQIPEISDFLKNVSIDSKSKKGEKSIYRGMVAEDIINYIKAAITYDKMPLRDNDSFIKIVNKPQRYINLAVIGENSIDFEELRKIYQESKEITDNIEKLKFHFDMVRKLNPSGAITYIKHGVGYENYLRKYAIDHNMKREALIKQMDDIYNEALKYNTLKEWIWSIENEKNNRSQKDKEGINIITMHGSKGLEFKIVFILDANQGVVPTSKAVRERDYEEERRVFYVAITRAIEELCVYGVAQSLGCDVEMSMFANEIIC